MAKIYQIIKSDKKRTIKNHISRTFWGIIAVMDASLLAVVSLPFLFLLLAFCAPSSAAWQKMKENEKGRSMLFKSFGFRNRLLPLKYFVESVHKYWVVLSCSCFLPVDGPATCLFFRYFKWPTRIATSILVDSSLPYHPKGLTCLVSVCTSKGPPTKLP